MRSDSETLTTTATAVADWLTTVPRQPAAAGSATASSCGSSNCDRGFVELLDDHGRPRVRRCDDCDHQRIHDAIRDFLPPRFRAPIDVPAEVEAWAARGRNADGLYLTGPVGAGKTHTAMYALARWCQATGTVPRGAHVEDEWAGLGRRHPTAVVVRSTTMLDRLRPGNDDHRTFVTDCQRAALLLVDDLGAEKGSEWVIEQLYTIVDERYVQQRPIIVTSNVPPAKLAEHVGERVASRFSEMCTVIPITGADRRRTPAALGT